MLVFYSLTFIYLLTVVVLCNEIIEFQVFFVTRQADDQN